MSIDNSNEPALSQWARTSPVDGDRPVSEANISGHHSDGGHESGFADSGFEGHDAHHAADVEGEHVIAADDGSVAKPKAKKNTKAMFIGLGLVTLLVIGMAVMRHKPQQHLANEAETGSAESAVAQPQAGQVDTTGNIATAPPAQGNGANAMPVYGADAASAPNAAGPGAAMSPVMPASQATGVSPLVTQTQPSGAQIGTPVVPQVGTPATQMQSAANAQPGSDTVATLTARVAALESQTRTSSADEQEISALKQAVAALQGSGGNRARPAEHAKQISVAQNAPAHRESKKAEGAVHKSGADAQAPAAAASQSNVAKTSQAPAHADSQAPQWSKVRDDYRVYATVEGRVWVRSGKGESELVDVRSKLMDGSTVEKVLPEVPMVVTSKGEIR